jgi:hypothetical protein
MGRPPLKINRPFDLGIATATDSVIFSIYLAGGAYWRRVDDAAARSKWPISAAHGRPCFTDNYVNCQRMLGEQWLTEVQMIRRAANRNWR